MSVLGSSGSATPGVDSGHFRWVLGHFPTGVVVVTAMAGGRPVGLSVASFCSLSLDPPLVLFCVGRGSTSWPAIAASGRFCANVLSRDQEHLSRVFARSGGDKFAGLPWTPSEGGSPLLDGALAWVDCHIESISEAGDHFVVISSVEALNVVRDAPALVFFRGAYGHVQPAEIRSA